MRLYLCVCPYFECNLELRNLGVVGDDCGAGLSGQGAVRLVR
jgi:hypothetical protein